MPETVADLSLQSARVEINQAVCEIVKKHGLTYGELTAIVAQCLQSWAKWQVREERQEEARSSE